MFYVIFGITFAGEQARGVGMTTYMLVTYGAFGVIGAALFGFGVSVAVERGQGWMRLKRVAPMPPLAYFVAKVVMSLAVATIIVLAMFTLGALVGGVRLDPQQWVAVGLALVAVRCRSRRWAWLRPWWPRLAGADLAWLMAFGRGRDPDPRRGVAVGRGRSPRRITSCSSALGTIGASEGGSPVVHAAAVLGFTVLFLVVAAWGFRRDEGRTYG